MSFLKPGDPARRGVEERPVTGLGCLDSDTHCEMVFAVPGGPSMTTFFGFGEP